MKKTFAATVVGLGETDTSGYTAGAHIISLAIDGAAPLGPAPRKVELPIFTREEARELGALYRTENAVRVIVETGDTQTTAAGALGFRLPEEAPAARESASTNEKGAPPLVNGRPSCCAAAIKKQLPSHFHGSWQMQDGSIYHRISFCPFCGARLPEVPT